MRYVGKKLVGLVMALLMVSILAFLSFEIIPGDAARLRLGTQASKDQVEALREEMGLTRSLPERYVTWVADFVQGDMGTSYRYEEPVADLILDKVPVTLTLSAMALVFILVLSIPCGVLSAKYENRFLDRFFLILNQVTMSVPPFFLGMILTVVFGLSLRWFVPGGYVSYQEDPGGFFAYLILPALAVALPKAAMTTKMLRSSLLTQMHQDYVRTAYSHGCSPLRVLLVHALKNGILPVVTFLGWAAADMLANSIVVEQVFGIPGIGRILISSISNRDYPVVAALVVLLAVVILGINTCVDLLYRLLDRRIKVS